MIFWIQIGLKSAAFILLKKRLATALNASLCGSLFFGRPEKINSGAHCYKRVKWDLLQAAGYRVPTKNHKHRVGWLIPMVAGSALGGGRLSKRRIGLGLGRLESARLFERF